MARKRGLERDDVSRWQSTDGGDAALPVAQGRVDRRFEKVAFLTGNIFKSCTRAL